MDLDMNEAADQIGALMDTAATETDSNEEVEKEELPEQEEESAEPEESDEPEPKEPEAPAKFKVKVQGEELDVELNELVNGYQRNADYTKKSQELAAKMRALELAPIPEPVKQQIAYYEKLLGELVAQDAKTDWVQLAKDDPAGYIVKVAEANQRAAAFKQSQEKQQAEERLNLEKRQSQEMEQLLTKIPAWKDRKVSTAESQKMKDYLQSEGVSPEEVNEIIDHRLIVIADKARRYDELMSAKPAVDKKIEKLPPKVERAGTKSSNSQKGVEDAMARLKKTGSLDDAVAVLSSF